MAVYKLSGYPKTLQVSSGPQITVRPMTRDDGPALLAFFRRIPDDERYFLKDDVASESVIDSWAQHLDYDRALPLLAFDGDRVCADAVLIRHRGDARSHYAEIRVVVDPEYRGRGLGTALMKELIDIAWDAELELVQAEFVRDTQEDAVEAIKALGGVEAGSLKDAYRGRDGTSHDLVILRVPLGRYWQWSRF
ncbi:MAG TPA: GNAT family N-acetyltransferase [Tepidiformaceae bacterium]|jgi:GNAT superfamily N-acetyltransferase|nr:GNAT family N-acetyltransferase [Tepidiformaceae bacterium]